MYIYTYTHTHIYIYIYICILRNIITVTKSRRKGWTTHAARKGGRRNACRVVVGKFEGKGPHAKLGN